MRDADIHINRMYHRIHGADTFLLRQKPPVDVVALCSHDDNQSESNTLAIYVSRVIPISCVDVVNRFILSKFVFAIPILA